MKPRSFFGRLSRASDLAPEPQAAESDIVVMERPEAAVRVAEALTAPVAVAAPVVAQTAPAPVEIPAEPEARVREEVPTLASTTVATPVAAKQNEGEAYDEWDAEVEGQLTIDVYQTEEAIIIKSTIAGVVSEDLDISIDNDMVTIQGERRNCDEISEKDYYYQECYWGNFSRSVILPCDVKADEAQADLKNGILTIVLPKANATRAKKIQVKGA